MIEEAKEAAGGQGPVTEVEGELDTVIMQGFPGAN